MKKKDQKTAGAVILQTGSTITEKVQLLCNTHLSTICQVMIKSFHHQAQGDSRSRISPRN